MNPKKGCVRGIEFHDGIPLATESKTLQNHKWGQFSLVVVVVTEMISNRGQRKISGPYSADATWTDDHMKKKIAHNAKVPATQR